MSAPEISIIVPVYNVQKYLQKCVDSLRFQTLKNIQIILVDDGSTDLSAQICDEYMKQDKRIVVIHQQNQGLSSARNTGLKYATSPLVTFVDSDDCVSKQTYQQALSCMTDDIDLVCFGIEVVGDALMEHRQADQEYYKLPFEGLHKIEENVILKTDKSVCNKIFKRDLIKKFHIQFPCGLNNEDYCFFVKYASIANKVYFLNRQFYQYLRHSGSIMAETFLKSPKAIDHLKIMEDICAFYQQNNLITKHRHMVAAFFNDCFSYAYRYTPNTERTHICNLAKAIIEKYHLQVSDSIIKRIRFLEKGYNEYRSLKIFGVLIGEYFRKGDKRVYKIFKIPTLKIRSKDHEIYKYYLFGFPIFVVRRFKATSKWV